jgi:hypothetical protein
MKMRSIVKWMAIPAVVLAAACSNKDDSKLDDALSKDLALASQVNPYPQQFVSPQEMGYNGYAPNGQPMQYQAAQRAGGYYQQAPVYQAPAPTRTRTVYRSSGTSASRSSGTVARQPVRHTARDAAIGAAAGTVIGVVTTKDKVKGGVVGAAAGAVLGGIIGHTVDVQH